MCKENVLFQDYGVTVGDVVQWLSYANYSPDNNSTRLKQYIKNYDVARKITDYKKNGLWDNVPPANKVYNIDAIIDCFREYVETAEPVKPCPDHYHQCGNVDCPIYRRRQYSRDMWAKRKAAGAKAKAAKMQVTSLK